MLSIGIMKVNAKNEGGWHPSVTHKSASIHYRILSPIPRGGVSLISLELIFNALLSKDDDPSPIYRGRPLNLDAACATSTSSTVFPASSTSGMLGFVVPIRTSALQGIMMLRLHCAWVQFLSLLHMWSLPIKYTRGRDRSGGPFVRTSVEGDSAAIKIELFQMPSHYILTI